MRTHKKKRRVSGVKKVILILELLLLVGLIVYYGKTKLKEVVVKQAADQVVETIVTNQAKQMGASDEEIKQVLEQVSEEDKQAVEDIVINHLDSEVISQGTEYLEKGDIEGLKQYASEELSQEEIQQLMGLYEKYKDTIE